MLRTRTAVLWLAGLLAFIAVVVVSFPTRAKPETPVPSVPEGTALAFVPEFPYADRAWVAAAVSKTRPEARRLIDEIGPRIRVTPYWDPNARWSGWTDRYGANDYGISFNLARLDGDRQAGRDAIVVHELGHVVLMALLSGAVREQLVARIPAGRGCADAFSGDCARPVEKFADTFAKWALRGEFPEGAGYGVATPASLEDWGAPLAALAAQLDARP